MDTLPMPNSNVTEFLRRAKNSGDYAAMLTAIVLGADPHCYHDKYSVIACAIDGITKGEVGPEFLSALIKLGTRIDGKICHEDMPPLQYAITAQHFDTVKILLDSGASPNAVDKVGNTALHYVVGTPNMPACWSHGTSGE